MSSIQQIRALGEEIYNHVDDYLKGGFADDDVVAISSNHGRVTVEADSSGCVKKFANTEMYPFSSLVRDDENGGVEPDVDKIDDIANSWLFLD
jgi:hypothetical protein